MFRSKVVCAAVSLLVLGASAPAWSAESQAEVRYADGRLTVHVDHMPVGDVLRRIADATGAALRGDAPAGDVTLAVDNVPITVALDTMLGKHSFMLTYGAKGALRSIELLGAGVPMAPMPAATAQKPLAAEEAQATVLQHNVPAWGALVGAFGEEPLTVGRLLHAVVNDQRPDVRSAARESLLEAFLASPEVEVAYLSTLTPIDDTTLATMMRGSGDGASAEEWFSALSSRARSPELKKKASSVLGVLRSPPPQ